jgi:hypothetical protein
MMQLPFLFLKREAPTKGKKTTFAISRSLLEVEQKQTNSTRGLLIKFFELHLAIIIRFFMWF